MFVFTSTAYAQNFGTDILKHSDFTVSCPFSLTTGEIFNYSKSNVGIELRLGTELMNFEIRKKQISFGLCSTYNFNKYIFLREEIKTFNSNCFLEGIWIRFSLPKDLLLQADLNLGLAITEAKALSIDGKALDNYYNSLIFGSTVTVIKKLFEVGACQIDGSAGLELRGYFEKDSWFQSLGVIAGIKIKSRK